MLFFGRKKRKEEVDMEAEIAKIHAETIRKTELAKKELEKVNKLLNDYPDDIAAMIFAATGGTYRRQK